MNKPSKYQINESLVQKVLLEPIRNGADKLIIISGYVSHNMASWHMKKINEDSLPPIKISLIAGMYPVDGVNIELHEGLKELANFSDKQYSSFECKYIYQGTPVHSKVYLWMQENKPFIAFAGSANYTMNGFGKLQREYIVECNPTDAYNFYQSIESDSIICNHGEIEEYIKLYKNQQFHQFDQDIKHSSFEKVTLSLLTNRGDVGFGSGINWGIRRNGTKREPNQAYISVPTQVARSGFFPLLETLLFVFPAENKRFTKFKIATGNDLETSEVPLSVLFCIIEKNAFYECKDSVFPQFDNIPS